MFDNDVCDIIYSDVCNTCRIKFWVEHLQEGSTQRALILKCIFLYINFENLIRAVMETKYRVQLNVQPRSEYPEWQFNTTVERY